MDAPLKLVGVEGSPYSRKMRAVLRYRHIPFRWVYQHTPAAAALPTPKVPVIPVIAFPEPDGTYERVMTDSSPQIMVLEQMFPGRSVVPVDPVVEFLDYLIEDYADEWVTKMMYHYRWHHPGGIDKAGKLLPIQGTSVVADDQWAKQTAWITDRQIERRALVGSTDDNLPVIEESYVRLLHLLDDLFAEREFVMGDRPGRSDFGLFGQLTQLCWWDPEAVEVAVREAPRVVAWVGRTEDLSWVEPSDDGWIDRDIAVASLQPLLAEIGATYAPFMLANHEAFRVDDDTVRCEIHGRPYTQALFRYQRKCLDWLRDHYAAQADADRDAIDAAGRHRLRGPVRATVALFGHWTCPYVNRVDFALGQRGSPTS
ncbi:MAG: glutathione S-transferase [Acidimicrobiales bacterium]